MQKRKNKTNRFFGATAFLLIPFVFLAITVKENIESKDTAAICLMVAIALIILFGYKYLNLHKEEHAYHKIAIALWVPIGAVTCYFLNIYGGLGVVLATAITGVVASFLPSLNKQSVYLKALPSPIYCGAFVGMSSAVIAPSIGFIVAAGILAGVLYLLSKNLFHQIGGKLGTLAFGGVIIVSLISWLIS